MTRYCPNCSAEYQDWVEKCLDCGSTLVNTKPEKPEKIKEPESSIITRGDRKYYREPLVPIASYENITLAQLDKGILESEGIVSMISNADRIVTEITGTRNPQNGSITLLVKESDTEKAKEILNSIEKNFTETDVPEADDSESGPD